MFLYIDTILRDEFSIALLSNDKKIIEKKEYKNIQTDRLLEKIDNLLNANKITLKKLKAIFIKHTASKAYTSLRVGVTVANTFAYILKIPIYEVSGFDFNQENKVKYTKGIYAKKPNITTPKKQ